MINKINELLAEIEAFAPQTAADVEAFRIKILGKKGTLGALMEEFKTVPAEQKRELGQRINQVKNLATERINTLKEEFGNAAALKASKIDDMTRPGSSEQVGSRHPISIVKNEIVGIFSRHFNQEQAYALKLILSMIPIGIVGFALKDHLNAMLESPHILTIVGAMLLLTAALLAFAYYARPRVKENISYRDAFIIGLAQAVASMPGLSRSGSTIATGILLGNKKSAVAQFSFLMVLAPILGEMLLEVVGGEMVFDSIGLMPLLCGFVSAFVVGCLACKFMIGIVNKGKLIWFAIYCAVAGAVAIASNLL